MTNSSGGSRYARLDSTGHSWSVYYSKLAFSVKFIIVVCLLVTSVLFYFLIWGKSHPRGDLLEKLAQERHAGIKWENVDSARSSGTKKPKILRTLAPDVKLGIGQCPHPHESSQALLASIKLLDDDPVCKKALFAAACQLEKNLLYDNHLPVTCPKGKFY